jgi:pimeloyl-ACP methyl ester carboxylesterase
VELAVRVRPPPAAGLDRPGIVLVHGLASNSRLWDGVAAELARRGHPVAAVDLRGHGRSEKPDSGYDIATVADDVALVIDALGWPRPAVVGQSWGGNVVVELAHRHPGAARLIVGLDGGTIELRRRFPCWEDCARQLAPPRLEGTPRPELEHRLREAHPDWPDEGIDGVLASFRVLEDGTVEPWLTFDHHLLVLRGLWEHDPFARFATITTPVLLLPADDGNAEATAEKEAAIARALSTLRAGRVHWFRPADHDVHAQHPVVVATVLHDALTAVG